MACRIAGLAAIAMTLSDVQGHLPTELVGEGWHVDTKSVTAGSVAAASLLWISCSHLSSPVTIQYISND